MKFAISSNLFGSAKSDEVLSAAKELGFDGVQLSLACASGGADGLRAAMRQSGATVCCIDSAIDWNATKMDASAAAMLGGAIELASAVGANFVCLSDIPMKRGQDRGQITAQLLNWLRPLADQAADAGVIISLVNAATRQSLLNQSSGMWTFLDQIDHPSVAACWNLANAAQVGESPTISLPVLKSRIAYVQTRDDWMKPGFVFGSPLPGNEPAASGDASIPRLARLEPAIKRLRGLGYEGFVTIDQPAMNEPRTWLAGGLALLRQWDTRLEVSDAEAAAGIKS